MIKEKQELLRQLKSHPAGRTLIEFLKEEKDDLRDVTKAKSWEEAQGRQFAVKIIDKLFSFLEEPKAKPKRKNTYV